jgi:KipI family sensor histidine kinase inhibitor
VIAPAAGRPEEIRIEPLGDQALLVRFGHRIDPDVNRQVHALAAALRASRPRWLRDLVPAYASLGVFVCDADEDTSVAAAERWIRSHIDALPALGSESDARSETGRLIEIDVAYGGTAGPDLDDVARLCGLSPAAVIDRHAAVEYRVAMLGFAPGFPYLLGLDPALEVPRLAQPRRRVEAGSVAIGGAQTGIYPRPGPGGWRVIGRTAQLLFDAGRDPPSLLQPGDRVRFIPARETV